MQFILKSHLILGICVLCLTAQTYWLYSEYNLPLTPLLINFVGTFCVYNLQKLYDATIEGNETQEKYNWYARNRKLVLTLIVLSLILSFNSVYVFLTENVIYFWFYLGTGVATSLYYLKPFRLKQFGWYKPFHISFIFVISCIIIPIHSKLSIDSIWYIISQFIFVFCLSVLYDYKDISQDLKSKLQTYAVRLKPLHFKLLVFIGSLAFIATSYMVVTSIFFSSLITGIYLIGLLYFLNEKRNYIYYLLLVDGALILQFTLTIIFS